MRAEKIQYAEQTQNVRKHKGHQHVGQQIVDGDTEPLAGAGNEDIQRIAALLGGFHSLFTHD